MSITTQFEEYDESKIAEEGQDSNTFKANAVTSFTWLRNVIKSLNIFKDEANSLRDEMNLIATGDTSSSQLAGHFGRLSTPFFKSNLKNKMYLQRLIDEGQATYTRNSPATYFDTRGDFQYAVADEFRFGKNGIVTEGERTNLILNSVLLSSGILCTRSDGNTGVDNSELFNKYTTSVDSETESYKDLRAVPNSELTDVEKYTFSIWVDPTDCSNDLIRLRYAYGSVASVVFNLSTKEFSNNGAEDFGYEEENGFIRVWMTATYSTHTNGLLARVQFSDHSIGDTISVQFSQLEKGSKPSSYIPTDDSTITRLADNLIYDKDNIPKTGDGISLRCKGKIIADSTTVVSQFYLYVGQKLFGVFFILGINMNNKRIEFTMINELNTVRSIVSDADSVEFGDEFIVTGTYEGTTLKLYLNGELVAWNTNELNVVADGELTGIKLTGWGNLNDDGAKGTVDISEIDIYDEVLTSIEIALNDGGLKMNNKVIYIEDYESYQSEIKTKELYIPHTPILMNGNKALYVTLDDLDLDSIEVLGTYEEVFTDEEKLEKYKSVYDYETPTTYIDDNGDEQTQEKSKYIGKITVKELTELELLQENKRLGTNYTHTDENTYKVSYTAEDANGLTSLKVSVDTFGFFATNFHFENGAVVPIENKEDLLALGAFVVQTRAKLFEV